MKVLHAFDRSQLEADVALTIGSFDGLHRGHQYLLGRLVSHARERQLWSAVLTFDPHPRAVLHPDLPQAYLSDPQEREAALAALGVDVLVLLPFTPELAATSAADFVQELCEELRMRELWVGQDFALGRNREGDVPHLQALAAELGYILRVVAPLCEGGQPISSTRIRRLLAKGRVREAAALLGRPYRLTGRVVGGARRGRSLGFRTANLSIPPQRALPADGVYAVWVQRGAERYQGVANIGIRPSFDGGERLLEVHLLDFQGDLYGQVLGVEFIQRLREEIRFSSPDALIEQIRKDVQRARELLTAEVPRDGQGSVAGF